MPARTPPNRKTVISPPAVASPTPPADQKLLAYGINLGYGYAKSIVLGHEDGSRHCMFPSLVAEAGQLAHGSAAGVDEVEFLDRRYWVGEDALLATGTPDASVSNQRLRSPYFYPVLLRHTLNKLKLWDRPGVVVTGLPATSTTQANGQLLSQRFREATAEANLFPEGQLYVIPEPLCLLYAWSLNDEGKELYAEQLQRAEYGYLDLGHYTVDGGTIRDRRVTRDSLFTRNLGSHAYLGQIRAQLIAHFDREFTLFETDEAVRRGTVEVRNKPMPLPNGWDKPVIRNAKALVASLTDEWGSGDQFRNIIVGGGGAEQSITMDILAESFDHINAVPEPQMAIALGAARRARQLMAV